MKISNNDELYAVIMCEVYSLTLSNSKEVINPKLVENSKWVGTKYETPLKKLYGPFEQSLFIAYLKDKYELSEDCSCMLDEVDSFCGEMLPFYSICMSISGWLESEGYFDEYVETFSKNHIRTLTKIGTSDTNIHSFIIAQTERGIYKSIICEGKEGFFYYSKMLFSSYTQAMHWTVNALSNCFRIYHIAGRLDSFKCNYAEIYKKVEITSRVVLHFMKDLNDENIHLAKGKKIIIKEYANNSRISGVVNRYFDSLKRAFGEEVIVISEVNGDNYCLRSSSKLLIDSLPDGQRKLLKDLVCDVVIASEEPVKQIIVDLSERPGKDGVHRSYTSKTFLGKEKAVDVFSGWSMVSDLSWLYCIDGYYTYLNM